MIGRHPRRWLGAAIAAALLLLLAPRVFARGILNDIWSVAFAVVLASAWNLLGGLAGQVSIGYSAFLGIGAYTTALLALRGVEPYATLPLAALLGAAFTIGVGEAVRVFASGVSFTGGSSGIRMPPASFDFALNYTSMVVLAVAVVTLAAWLRGSRFGAALAAIRQDIDAAEALGINATRYKLAVHALSAGLVAAAGSLFAINFQYISPGSVFDFRLSLSIVLMPIVGGVGTVAGPVWGAIVFSYLQIKMLSVPALRDSYLFLYGTLLILVMLFEPKGLLGLGKRLLRALRRPARVANGA
jgi:branched-chain amino acid transport system permease protein